MPPFRFVHCSDLHIDSPFKGLSGVQPRLADRLRRSTFRAFQNIVDLAIREAVDAVLIAGDIYDSADKSLQAQLKFHRGLKQLAQAGIPAFIVHGNHDPLDSWAASLDWPETVTIFPGDRVAAVPVVRDGQTLATIHGMSFPSREVHDNLAPRFQRGSDPGWAVGLLHTNVGAQPGHDNYAPCSVDDLVATGMDYWALGHIHAHQTLRENSPAIVYAGNPQARHMGETGVKGCCLVTLETSSCRVEFAPVDAVRFMTHTLDVSECATLGELIPSVQQACETRAAQAPDRDVVLRITLRGRTPLHAELGRPGVRQDLGEEIQNYFNNQESGLWVELVWDTQGPYDIEELRQGGDFIADVLRLYEHTGEHPDPEEFRELLKPLFETWQGRNYLAPLSAEDFQEVLRQARDLTLDRLHEKS